MKESIDEVLKNIFDYIESPSNRIIKLVKKMMLFPQENPMYCIVEGEKNITEMCKSLYLEIVKVFVLKSDIEKSSFIKNFSRHMVIFVSDRVLSYLTDLEQHQNCVAVFLLRYDIFNLSDLMSIDATYILDEIQDPGNMGTLLRTAVALQKNSIVVLGGVFPLHQKVIRAASGMLGKLRIFFLKSRYYLPDIFYFTRKIALLDMSGEVLSMKNILKFESFFFVLGNESHGIADFWRKMELPIVSLMMSVQVESLNVAIAGSVAGYMVWGMNNEKI